MYGLSNFYISVWMGVFLLSAGMQCYCKGLPKKLKCKWDYEFIVESGHPAAHVQCSSA